MSGIVNATQVAVGDQFACAMVAGGSVYCWGFNYDGELGNGANSGPQACGAFPCSTIPVQVSGISDATALATTDDSACALLATGDVDCWGADGEGTLGDGKIWRHSNCYRAAAEPCDSLPVQVASISNATQIAGQREAMCALLVNRTIDCWGQSADQQTGAPNPYLHDVCQFAQWCNWTPIAVSGISNVAELAGPWCASTPNGAVYCWQDDSYGQLGNGPRYVSLPISATYGCLAVDAPGGNTIPCSAKPVKVNFAAAYRCDVPRFDLTAAIAQRDARAAGCRIGSIRFARARSRSLRGQVIAQSVRPGSVRQRGSRINLVVGR